MATICNFDPVEVYLAGLLSLMLIMLTARSRNGQQDRTAISAWQGAILARFQQQARQSGILVMRVQVSSTRFDLAEIEKLIEQVLCRPKV
jgi:hypothetical protein